MPSLQPHVNGRGVHESEHGMQDIARVLWAWRGTLCTMLAWSRHLPCVCASRFRLPADCIDAAGSPA